MFITMTTMIMTARIPLVDFKEGFYCVLLGEVLTASLSVRELGLF